MRLLCPKCYSPERLGTLEVIEGAAGATITMSDSGQVEVDYDGGTDVFWDSSTTVGVICQSCSWQHKGDDWASALVPAPSMAHLVQVVLDHLDNPGPGADQPDPGEALVHATVALARSGAKSPTNARTVAVVAMLDDPNPDAYFPYPSRMLVLVEEVTELLPSAEGAAADR